jgi:Restriction endonuclease NaeI
VENAPAPLFDVDEYRPAAPRAGEGALSTHDSGLVQVERWFHRHSSSLEEKFGAALRQSIDEVLDGQRTGRFDVEELEKTEKTYLGTKVEIVVRSAFDLDRGASMDYSIADCEVDAKWTSGKNWTIPTEAVGHICLLMSADDHESSFRVGLLKITDDIMNRGANKDGKRTLSAEGRTAIRWLIPDGRLPENLLLTLSEGDRSAIFNAGGPYRATPGGGQKRINELLRRVQGRVVDRTTAITVATQLDGPKRVRDARKYLQPEGILVLGHQGNDPKVARALGLPVPTKGSWLSVRVSRVSPGSGRPAATINGELYAVALPGEPVEPAPS